MGLNVKAAMAVCGLCISALPVCLERLTLTRGHGPVTLMEGKVPLDVGLGVRPVPAAPIGEPGDWREQWAQRLNNRNPLELERDRNRMAGPSLAVMTPVALDDGTDHSPALPPLAYDPPVPDPALATSVQTDLVEAAPAAPLVAGTAPASADPPLAEAEPPPLKLARTYRVAKGDTLTRIAQRAYDTRDASVVQMLIDANPRVRARQGKLLAGEELILPQPTLASSVDPSPTSPRTPVSAPVGSLLGGGADPRGTDAPRWYTIQRNDSLRSIAKRFLADPARWREIVELNRSLDPNKILPGMRIKLPPGVRVASR